VSLGSIAYVGNHGGELLRPAGREPELAPDIAAYVPRIQAFAAGAWTDELHRLRVRFEDKGPIAAYHWRGAPDERAAQAAIAEIAEQATTAGLVTHWGRKVLEVRPPVPFDKGRGVLRLLAEADIDAALYCGDDATDIDAFSALKAEQERGRLSTAICAGVRSDETPEALERGADLLVDGPQGVRGLLLALLD
jgi:trehalose 6-phosphate phosphatase